MARDCEAVMMLAGEAFAALMRGESAESYYKEAGHLAAIVKSIATSNHDNTVCKARVVIRLAGGNPLRLERILERVKCQHVAALAREHAHNEQSLPKMLWKPLRP